MSDSAPATVLSTMQPDPAWDAASHEDAVETLGSEGLTFRIWGGDWCPDCRNQLPQFAAALEAAGVADDHIHVYAVEREDGEKVGDGMAEYGVDFIPTVVVEDASGQEIVRYVEEEATPIAEHLAEAVENAK